MSFGLEIWESAKDETVEAYKWYEEKSLGLGEQFIKVVSVCYKKIKNNPYQFQERGKGFRAAITEGFPYIIVYVIDYETITIYSVFHTSRNPKQLHKKLRGKQK